MECYKTLLSKGVNILLGQPVVLLLHVYMLVYSDQDNGIMSLFTSMTYITERQYKALSIKGSNYCWWLTDSITIPNVAITDYT